MEKIYANFSGEIVTSSSVLDHWKVIIGRMKFFSAEAKTEIFTLFLYCGFHISAYGLQVPNCLLGSLDRRNTIMSISLLFSWLFSHFEILV